MQIPFSRMYIEHVHVCMSQATQKKRVRKNEWEWMNEWERERERERERDVCMKDDMKGNTEIRLCWNSCNNKLHKQSLQYM